MNNRELFHHGIKGQKWGIRRYQDQDGSLTNAGKTRYNKHYTKQDRLIDESVYGKSGVKRINRSMNKGNSIEKSRSKETQRLYSAKVRASNGIVVGGTAGALAGWGIGEIGYSTLKYAMRYSSNKTMNQIAKTLDNNVYADLTAHILAMTGSTQIGGAIGRKAGKTAGMRSKGYSSKLY